MTDPNERLIELYAYNSALSLLSREDDQWIYNWIEYDEDIQKLASWFKKFYATFNQIEASKAKGAEYPSVIQLRSLKSNISLPRLFSLTAQMPVIETYESTLKSFKVFVSDRYNTMLRVVYGKRDNQINLQVISNCVSQDDIVLLRVNTEDQLLVSEPGGSFHFPNRKTNPEPDTDIDIDLWLKKIASWTHCQMHLAVDKIRLYKDSNTGEVNFDTTEYNRDREALNLTTTNNELRISFQPSFNDRANPQRVVFISGRQSTYLEINAGVFSIPLDMMNETQARLYFYDSYNE